MGETPVVHRRLASLFAASVLVLLAACGGGSSDAADDTASTAAGEGSTTTTAGAEGGTFSVLSYNVAGLPQEVSKEHPEEHLPLVSPLLNAYDLVLTQEDFDWWKPDGLASTLDFIHYHERLRADVTHEYQSPRHPGPEAVGLDPTSRPLEIGDGEGLLSRFPLSGYDRQPWKGCFGGLDTSDGGAADCLAMKGFLVAETELADGKAVDVYTLHAEAGGTEADQSLQADDFEQLAAYVAEHSKGHAVILGGDTNLHTDLVHPDGHQGDDIEIWDAFLDATGLTDSCTELKCSSPGSIDKVAYRDGGGVDLTATSWDKPADRFVDAAGEDLSDHEPLVVELRWQPA